MNIRGIAAPIMCALGGAIMGLAVIFYAMSQSNIEQTISLQAAENSYISAIHVSEQARLFFAKAMDFVLQLAIEDVSAHGGLTSKAPATGMKTTADGVRYWRWCSQTSLPATCDNSNCGPMFIPEEELVENAKKNMSASMTGYLDDYVTAFEKNEGSHETKITPSNQNLVLGEDKVEYSSSLNTKVLTRPPGISLDKSFRTHGVVDSSDVLTISQNVKMPDALEMALNEAKTLTKSGAFTYGCTSSSKAFARKCPVKKPKLCEKCTINKDGKKDCTSVDCSSCDEIEVESTGTYTVTDYDCLVTFDVPDSKMAYTLSAGKIEAKQQKFTMAVSYRKWSSPCIVPVGSGECGACEYVGA